VPNLVEIGQYDDFCIFQDGGCRYLGFFKFEIINGRTAHQDRTASPYQIWLKSGKLRQRYDVFFDFPRLRPSASLDLLCVCSDHHKGNLVVFIAVQHLVGIGAVVLIICMFFDFASLA